MNFYRVNTIQQLYSFGDAIGAVPILFKPLKEHQEKAIDKIGGKIIDIESESEIEDIGPYFIIPSESYFTHNFIKSCVDLSLKTQSNLNYILKGNTFNERFVLPCENNISYHETGIKYISHKNKELTNKIVPQRIFEHTVEFPEQLVQGRTYHLDQSEDFAIRIISPFHLLMANMAANFARIAHTQAKLPSYLQNRKGKSKPWWMFAAMKRMNKIGKNCEIHPSALIEGSIIGDNVIIGAHSVIRHSVIADGCRIADNVVVAASVIGEKSSIANSNFISSCMTYEQVFLIHGPYHFSIFGAHSACFAVINCDIRLDQKTIKIPTVNGIVDSNQPILGIAYGHRSKTGGGNIIAAGRIVPNDLHINPPDSIILNFDKT